MTNGLSGVDSGHKGDENDKKYDLEERTARYRE
jgi:hypothetical protein